MDIKLGIAEVNREIKLDTDETVEEITERLKKVLAEDGILELTDTKGGKVLVPAYRIGYIELGSSTARPVGFGTPSL